MGIDPVAGDEKVGIVEGCDRCDVGGIKPVAITFVAGVGWKIKLFIAINYNSVYQVLQYLLTDIKQMKFLF